MNNQTFKRSLLSTAIALPLVAMSVNAEPVITEEQRFIVTFKADKKLQSTNTLSTRQTAQVNTLFDNKAASVNAEIVKRLPNSNAMAVVLTASP